MKRYNFIKTRESVPKIDSQNNIVDDKAGGIKLEYNVYVTDNVHMRIGKRDIYIPTWKYPSKKLVFIKLLKKYWDFEKYKMAKNFHGTPKDKYTNLWLILQNRKGSTDCYEDVISIRRDLKSLRIKTLCTKQEHHQIIKYLAKRSKRFSIPFTQFF